MKDFYSLENLKRIIDSEALDLELKKADVNAQITVRAFKTLLDEITSLKERVAILEQRIAELEKFNET